MMGRVAPSPNWSEAWGGFDAAVAGAVNFLAGAQDADGVWRDFRLPVGRAEAWTTALVGRVLSATGQPDADPLAHRAATWLTRTAPEGRWGYNAEVPPDADSTAWAALLLDRVRLDQNTTIADLCFVASHHTPEGGFATYRAADGWGEAHACVTPVALMATEARLGLDPGARSWLAACRDADGAVRGHWWTSAFYPTLMARTVLGPVAGGDPFRSPALSRIGSAFDLACATLLAALDAPECTATRRLAATLAGLQRPDGGWPASRCLRVTPHWLGASGVAQGGHVPGAVFADDRRTVSTVFAAAALAVVSGQGAWP
ncbi:hypothetical protein [Roseivivax marinus]|uniref:hypothetical protein n=1 Tax=Roseivivax marinus TaxID=1379903 RepID=UPI00273EBB9D|nr:hypothetical protein [Roseivivax marinus]